MKRTAGHLVTIFGLALLFLLLLAILTLFFGRRYVRPLLPESLAAMLFPPLATPVESDYGPIFAPPELPEPPSSVIRAAKDWAEVRGWEFEPCERVSSDFRIFETERQSRPQRFRVYDDPDYATCLRYVRARVTDRGTENAMPGQWLPGHRFGGDARRDFEAILSRRPDFFYAAYLLGCWHRQSGDDVTATRYFEQAYASAPVVLVLSFDLIELAESWEQNRPPLVTLINSRTFAHNIDLTYHYGIDDDVMVRYPLLQADENGLVLIPAESDWLSWERAYYTGHRAIDSQGHPSQISPQRETLPDERPAVARASRKFDTAWRFRGRTKVALVQHEEIVVRPYDTNPMRSDPFFDPVWGTQQSLGVYERVAAFCESRNEPSWLYDRGTLVPMTHDRPTFWHRGRIVPFDASWHDTGGLEMSNVPKAGFALTESGMIRPLDGACLAVINSQDPRSLTWFLQQTGMTRSSLIEKIQTWLSGHAPDDEIAVRSDQGLVVAAVDRDNAAWLVKLVPIPASADATKDSEIPSYTVTTLRIGSLPGVYPCATAP